MSRLPTTSGIATINTKRLSRKPSFDLRKRKTISENVPPVPKSSKSITRSRSFIEEPQNYSVPNTPRSSFVTSPKPTYKSNNKLDIGDRVAVESMRIVGTLKFLGSTEFKDGYWAGIQLDIIGSGKNDGSVKGKRYFDCPANTGLFVLASKVTPLDNSDSDSVRSLSPPTNNHSRAARYIGMTANQLQQQQQQQQQLPKIKNRNPSISLRSISTTSSLQSPLTSPVSASSGGGFNGRRNSSGVRRSQSLVQSPTPTHHYNFGIPPSPAMTPTNHSVQDDYYPDAIMLSSSDDMLITDTPVPANLALSKSLTTQQQTSPSTSSTSHESPQERLERVLGEAINQAPDETVMRLQQLQLRVEVLEAENKYLKLENTQNKTAEQILSRSLVLNGEELFSLEGHKAIVEEIKEKHAIEEKAWKSKTDETSLAIQRLETKVLELEAEQQSLITERDKLLYEMSTIRKEKSIVEHRVHELESKVAEAEAATAAAQAGERLLSEKLQQHQPQHYFQPGLDNDAMDRQMKLEMEMEEVHEKMSSLRDAARAKDMFLATLSEQVETHRSAVEEKEREIRRIKADSDRHCREKDRLLEELKDVETKWLAHQDCTSKETFDKLKLELSTVKEKYAKESNLLQESRERINQLQSSVDELKRAGMESIELYESSVEMNRVDREAMNASLADERRKVASLEVEREELRKACEDVIEVYDGTIEKMKKERTTQIEDFETRRQASEATIDSLKKEIEQLTKNVESGEKQNILKDVWESERKRLVEQIESLQHDKISHEALKVELECLKDQTKETDKLAKEKTKLEEQLARLQADFDEQLLSRTKYLEEKRTTVETLKKTEGELRRVNESKEKLERELLEQKESKGNQLEIETFRIEIEKLKAQNEMLLKQKQEVQQGQQDLSQYQHLVATLKSENKKLARENLKLEETHKQSETECLKLMEEVEKLHGQISQDEVTKLVLKQDLSDEDKIAKILQQNNEKVKKMMNEHTTELNTIKEKNQLNEKEYKRKITLLNRDISELESLIESKIFKEDDLEKALEKERKQVKKLELEIQDAKEEKKEKLEFQDTKEEKKETSKKPTIDTVYCEICEVPGHDLISCKAITSDNRPFCENCEEFGLHFTNKCPNQNETF